MLSVFGSIISHTAAQIKYFFFIAPNRPCELQRLVLITLVGAPGAVALCPVSTRAAAPVSTQHCGLPAASGTSCARRVGFPPLVYEHTLK